MSFSWRVSKQDCDSREEIKMSEEWFCFKITVNPFGPEYEIKVYEGQFNTKSTAHLTQIDNQATDKSSLEDKLKSNSQVSLK